MTEDQRPPEIYALKLVDTDQLKSDLSDRYELVRGNFRGCRLPGCSVADVARELAERALREPSLEDQKRQITRAAELWWSICDEIGADRPELIEDVWQHEAALEGAIADAAADRSASEDKQATAAAQSELKKLVQQIGEAYGVRGAKGFKDWMHTDDADQFGDVLLDIEKMGGKSADAVLRYAANDDVVREIRLKTIEKWIAEVPMEEAVGTSKSRMDVLMEKAG